MENKELETAIENGIIKGGLFLAFILFIVWRFLPVILPFSDAVVAWTVMTVSNWNWLKILEGFITLLEIAGVIALIALVAYVILIPVKKTRTYQKVITHLRKTPFYEEDGSKVDVDRIICVLFLFVFLAGLSWGLYDLSVTTRKFNRDDGLGIFGLSLGFLCFAYLAFRSRKVKVVDGDH